MKKYITYTLIGAFLIALVLFGYYSFRKSYINKVELSVYELIPDRSSLILEADNFSDLINKLKGSNIIWADLINIPFWAGIDSSLSTLGENQDYIKKITSSAIQTSGTKFEFISYIEFLNPPQKGDITTFLHAKSTTQSQMVEGREVSEISKNGENLYFSVVESFCVISPEISLVEESIIALKNKSSLNADSDFKKAYQYSGNDLNGNLLINFKALPILFNQTMNKRALERIQVLKQMGSWISLDLIVKPNHINCNGFITTNDSTAQILSVLEGQVPIKPSLFNVIPKYSSFFFYVGLSNFSSYVKSVEKETSLSLKDSKKVSAFFGNEMALLYLKKSTLGIYDEVAVFKIKDKEKALSYLRSEEITSDFLVNRFGSVFSGVSADHFKIIDDLLIFASKQEVISQFFGSNYSANAITTDISFLNFNDNFSRSCNVYSYMKPSANKLLLSEYFSDKSLLYYDKYDFIFNKFEALAFQVNVEKDNLFYMTVSAKYNPTTKKAPSLLWEFSPENVVLREPFYFKNHKNNLTEIFIQDINDNVYLLSTAGKLLWKKKLDGQLIGAIHQVDAYKNNKYQLLLSTENKIYLLDRNGKDVENYPITIEHGLTKSGINLFDYEKNRDYRLLVPTKKNEILNYKISGEQVEGWQFEKTKKQVDQPIKHLAVNNKDYIVIVDSKGKVYVLDRRGEQRLEINQEIDLSEENEFFISKSTSINKSHLLYTDKTGTVNKLYFNSKQESFNTKTFLTDHKFVVDNSSKEPINYIFTQGSEAIVYDQDQNVLTSFRADSTVSEHPKTFKFDGSKYLGLTSRLSNKIYLMDSFGVLYETFPLEGNTSFPIKDINNDGVMDLAVGTADGTIRVYSLTK